MLTKIGNDWVDLAEIAAAEYIMAGKQDPECFLVILRSGAETCLYCSPGELEDALVRAGVAERAEKPAFLISDNWVAELGELRARGFRYLARDDDGTLTAYKHMPKKEGGIWVTTDTMELDITAFPFVAAFRKEPFDIAMVVGGHAEV